MLITISLLILANLIMGKDVCKHCGAEIIELAYASPAWIIRALCGYGGRMAIRPNCL